MIEELLVDRLPGRRRFPPGRCAAVDRTSRRLRLAVLAGSSAPGCSRGCPTTTRPASRPTRSSAPTTATSCSGCCARRPSALILFHELGGADGDRHRPGPGRAGPRALRRARRGVAVRRPRRRQPRDDVRRVRGRRRGARPRRRPALLSVPDRRGRRLAARAAAAGSSASSTCCWPSAPLIVTYIVAGLLAGPDWGAAARGPWCRRLPLDARRRARGHRDGRDDAGALGPRVHPVLRGRQAPDAARPPPRARRRRGGRGPDRRDRRLRRRSPARRPCTSTAARSTTPATPRRRSSRWPAALRRALFGAGLLGAALLAASILPLSTAYSVSEALGVEAALDDSIARRRSSTAPTRSVVAVAVAIVLIPGAPLVPILFLTQALNASCCCRCSCSSYGIARDPRVMGEHALGRADAAIALLIIVVVAVCVAALAVLTIF